MKGVVLAYSFDGKNAGLIGKAAEIRSYDSNYCLLARSKFQAGGGDGGRQRC